LKEVPRDGIEPPTPAFSGRRGGFLLCLLTQRDSRQQLYHVRLAGHSETTYNFQRADFGSFCMEKCPNVQTKERELISFLRQNRQCFHPFEISKRIPRGAQLDVKTTTPQAGRQTGEIT
jgi:hypothetical protein